MEDLLAARGLAVSYESIRCRVLTFGPVIARRLRQRRPKPTAYRHLDEMVRRIAGQRLYLWRAIDDEGEVLDVLVRRGRNKAAARTFAALATSPEDKRQDERIRKSMLESHLVIGVDRLDYSNGLPDRLGAIEMPIEEPRNRWSGMMQVLR